jgi:hypothetical protein
VSRWFDKAVREPGHPAAQGYPGHDPLGPKPGIVYHSAEGSLASMRRIIQRPGEPSWGFSNPKKGRLIQHYPRGSHTWANGSQINNVRYDACESEGVAGEPLTASQVDNLVYLGRWYKAEEHWAGFRRRIEAWEHRELHPTECPSDRIPWDIIIPRVEDVDMPDTELRNRAYITSVLREAAAYAERGEPWPDELYAKLKAVVALHDLSP